MSKIQSAEQYQRSLAQVRQILAHNEPSLEALHTAVRGALGSKRHAERAAQLLGDITQQRWSNLDTPNHDARQLLHKHQRNAPLIGVVFDELVRAKVFADSDEMRQRIGILTGSVPDYNRDVAPGSSQKTRIRRSDLASLIMRLTRTPKLTEYGKFLAEESRGISTPTFLFENWLHFHPDCVSRTILVKDRATRTRQMNQPSSIYDFHLFGLANNAPIYIMSYAQGRYIHEYECGGLDSQNNAQRLPALYIVQHNGWHTLDAQNNVLVPSQAAPLGVNDAPFRAMLEALAFAQKPQNPAAFGRKVTPQTVQSARNLVADQLQALGETAHDAVYQDARAVVEQFEVEVGGQAFLNLALRVMHFEPPAVPTFMWDHGLWPHPDCVTPATLLPVLINRICKDGTWGSELEANAAGLATETTIHIWKPAQEVGDARKQEQAASRVYRAAAFDNRGAANQAAFTRIITVGAKPSNDNLKVIHLVNFGETHYQRFVPQSLQAAGANPKPGEPYVTTEGESVECGGAGNCLYHAIVGRDNNEDVACLRLQTASYIMSHAQTFSDIAQSWLQDAWVRFGEQEGARLSESRDDGQTSTPANKKLAKQLAQQALVQNEASLCAAYAAKYQERILKKPLEQTQVGA